MAENEAVKLVSLLGAQGIWLEQARVLEVGCGSGALALALGRHCLTVVAVDKRKDSIEEARLQAAQAGVTNVTFVASDVASLRRSVCDGINVNLINFQEKQTKGIFDVILTKNAVQFFDKVSNFMDDVKYLIAKGGSYVQISSPLFMIGVEGDPVKSAKINFEMENFLSLKFFKELKNYWSANEKKNFEVYCDPRRKKGRRDMSTVQEMEVKTEMNLLDLKKHIKEITVVQNFMKNKKDKSKPKSDEFDQIFDDFLKQISSHLDVPYAELFFEDVNVVKTDKFFVEIDNRSQYKSIPSPTRVLPSPSFTPSLLSLSSCPLASLNPDVMGLICRHLSCSSLASLETSGHAVRRAMQQARVWRQKALSLDAGAPYRLVSQSLVMARTRGLRAEAGFKIILGVRRQIKKSCRAFYEVFMLNKSQHYLYCCKRFPVNLAYEAFNRALQSHLIARLNGFKAWSLAGDEGEGSSDRLCQEAFLEDAVVMEVVARWRQVAETSFSWSEEEEDRGIYDRISPPSPEELADPLLPVMAQGQAQDQEFMM